MIEFKNLKEVRKEKVDIEDVTPEMARLILIAKTLEKIGRNLRSE